MTEEQGEFKVSQEGLMQVVQAMDNMIGKYFTGFGIDRANEQPVVRLRAYCRLCKGEITASKYLSPDSPWGAYLMNNMGQEAVTHMEDKHSSPLILPQNPGDFWEPNR